MVATNRLDDILKRDGWKFTEFAKTADISVSYLNKIRKQKCPPSEPLMNRIVNTLNNNSRKSRQAPYTVKEVFPKAKQARK